MIRVKHRGSFKKAERFLKNGSQRDYLKILDRYGAEGCSALASATPVDSGKTASSWTYEIVKADSEVVIYWRNSNVHKGVNIALILQYGHGTGTGGYVEGIDYVNPALRPVFDKLAEEAWNSIIS